jgi:hypothetical protein
MIKLITIIIGIMDLLLYLFIIKLLRKFQFSFTHNIRDNFLFLAEKYRFFCFFLALIENDE